jgi:LmbE family N-acetylglucosaminyl deacetylase
MDNGLCFSPADHLVAVVAHPDDESFGCGSLIALAAAAGAKVTVVCATCGEAGEPSPRTDLAGRTLGEVREAELRRAARLLGADRVVMLGYADSGFDGDCPRGTLCAAPLADVTHRLGAVLTALRPTVLLTLDGSDGHRDHVHVRDALLATRPSCPVYLSTIPNRLMRRWLDAFLATDHVIRAA